MIYLPTLKRRTLMLGLTLTPFLLLHADLKMPPWLLAVTGIFILHPAYTFYKNATRKIQHLNPNLLSEKNPTLQRLCEEVQQKMIDKGLLHQNKKIQYYMTTHDDLKTRHLCTMGIGQNHVLLISKALLNKLVVAKKFDAAAFQALVAQTLCSVANNAETTKNLLPIIATITQFSVLLPSKITGFFLVDFFSSLCIRSIHRNYQYDADHLTTQCNYGRDLQRGLALLTDRTEWDSTLEDLARPSFLQIKRSFIKELFSDIPSTKHRLLAIERDIALQQLLKETTHQKTLTKRWNTWSKNCYTTFLQEVKHAFHNEIESYTAYRQSNEILLNAKSNQTISCFQQKHR